MLQGAKLMNELFNAGIGSLVSATPGSWLWRNVPVPVWKISSMRFSKRLSLCSARNHYTKKTTGLNFQAQAQATYILLMEQDAAHLWLAFDILLGQAAHICHVPYAKCYCRNRTPVLQYVCRLFSLSWLSVPSFLPLHYTGQLELW